MAGVDKELLQEIESCLTAQDWKGALVLEPESVTDIGVDGLTALKRGFSHILIVGLNADASPVPDQVDVDYHNMLA